MITLNTFELYLMSLMRGKSQINSVLASFGISTEAMEEAASQVAGTVGFLELAGFPLDVFRPILGAPIETTREPGIDVDSPFDGSKRHRFHLPLWSDFDFILRTHPAGWVWGPEFVRRPGVPSPTLGRARDLQPWSVVESEVVARFGPFACEDAWNLGKDATNVVVDSGVRVETVLVFDLALLQRVVVTESTA
jgi:hypothetical protein